MSVTALRAWHFVSDSRTLRDGRPIPARGVRLTHDGPLVPCESGLHASVRCLDALKYSPGAWLCRVECAGEIAHHGDPPDKIVCRERTIVADADATRMLHEFAIWCAEQALERVGNPDPRSLNALEVKRRWLRGEATDSELAAASAAASAAAWAAARDAARAAAWAAAWDAAWDAQAAELERRALALVGEA